MARRCSGTAKGSGLNVTSLVLALAVMIAAASSGFALDGRDGNAYTNFHRDRLLDTYAQYKGLGNRVDAWNSLNYKQKMLFLIQTDLLGNRTFMHPTRTNYYKENPGDGCNNGQEMCSSCSVAGGQRWCGSCEVWLDQPMDDTRPQINGCWSVDAYDCYQRGLCREEPQSRTDYEMALEHVTRLYEILGQDGFFGGCSGSDNNRIFWQAGTDSSNDQLIQALRNRTMPAWGANGDIGGVHEPFDNASSTINGRPFSCDGPDGQAQFYSWDTKCSYSGQKGCSNVQSFSRGSTYLPADSRMFELDNDYDTIHQSSPTCSYGWCGGKYGVTMYEEHWCPSQGNFAPCDWNYTPRPASYLVSASKTGTGTGTINSYPGGINCGGVCSANFSGGTQVTLAATADSGSTFAGWSGSCSGTGNCTVMVDAAKSVTATFNQNVYYTLNVGKAGTGKGAVGSNPGGINCDANCAGIAGWFLSGTQVTLAATADSGSTFAGWSGACSGTGTCTVDMYAAQSVTATFNTASTTSNAYWCYSTSYPNYGFQNWLCNAAYNPTYCYTSNWQWTSCPSSGGSSAQCGNGICETGENGSNCGQDCCDQSTVCSQTKQNGGLYYCWNMYYYDNGSAYWHGFKWVTANDTMQMCNDWYEAWEGSYYQTQYQCGGSSGKCHSIPGGYY